MQRSQNILMQLTISGSCGVSTAATPPHLRSHTHQSGSLSLFGICWGHAVTHVIVHRYRY